MCWFFFSCCSLRRSYGEDVEIPFSAVIFFFFYRPYFSVLLPVCLFPSWQHRYAGPSVCNQRVKRVCVSVQRLNKRCVSAEEKEKKEKKILKLHRIYSPKQCFIYLLYFPSSNLFFILLASLFYFPRVCSASCSLHCYSCGQINWGFH